MKMKNRIKKEVIVFLIIVLGCTFFKVLACALPTSVIQNRIKQSRITIENTGDYPTISEFNGAGEWIDAAWNQSDFFTEWLLVNTAYNVDSNHPLRSAMLNTRLFTDTSSPANSLLYNMDIDEEQSDNYENPIQYWFGSVAIIRFLLLFYDYSQILTLFQIITLILAGTSLVLVYKKTNDIKVILSYMLSLVVVSAFTVTFSITFSITFDIAFLSIIYLCCTKRKINELNIPFLIIGMLTAYFDWLSTPSITCTLPLLIVIILEKNEKRKNFLDIICNGVNWCLGYMGMIISKWIISSFITQESILEIVKGRIVSDIGADVDNKIIYYLECILNYGKMLITYKMHMNWIWVIAFVILVVGILLERKEKNFIIFQMKLLLIGGVPFLWAAVFLWHSHEHFWFTYRNLIPTIFAIIYMVLGVVERIKFCFLKKK